MNLTHSSLITKKQLHILWVLYILLHHFYPNIWIPNLIKIIVILCISIYDIYGSLYSNKVPKIYCMCVLCDVLSMETYSCKNNRYNIYLLFIYNFGS